SADEHTANVEADGSISVTATIANRPDVTASSSATNDPNAPTAGDSPTKFGGSLSLAIGNYDNIARATIGSDAAVDAGGALVVKAEALNDFTFGFGVNLISPWLSEPGFTTGQGTQTVSNGDTVLIEGGHTGGGDVGSLYKYIGSTPSVTRDLST